VEFNAIIHIILKLYDIISWNVVWVPEIKRLLLFNNVCGFYTDAVVLFSCKDVTLALRMLSFRSLLNFCDYKFSFFRYFDRLYIQTHKCTAHAVGNVAISISAEF